MTGQLRIYNHLSAKCNVYLKENASFPAEYNRPVVIYIVWCRGESRCTFIYFMCHLQLSVDGQGSGRREAAGSYWTTLPSNYKTVRSSASFVIEALRMDCDEHPTHGTYPLFISTRFTRTITSSGMETFAKLIN